MLDFRGYHKATSLEEAWELNQKKSNVVIGGMMWLRMGKRRAGTAIDLSGLGLDQIEEDDEEFRIGAMVTLRDLELSESINQYTNGAMKEAVRHIVGVQFRNMATVGGSIFGRFGFSDVLTMFMAMDTEVELYKAGIVPIEKFAAMSINRDFRDILVRLIVKKTPGRLAYQSVRNTATDFPTLTCAASVFGEHLPKGGSPFVAPLPTVIIGARPGRAMRVPLQEEMLGLTGEHRYSEFISRRSLVPMDIQWDAKTFAEFAAAKIPTGSNMRGSAEYRTHLIKVLVERTLTKLEEDQ
ncbi:MAG: FAD binding domain-containing protein [Lachnospiraceae bacterium]|nr:FAD binding domain-containing protein [Lachnospiraceae bacterium]